MPEQSFTLVIQGDVDEHLEDLFEAGCDDATFGSVDGVQYADFDRTSPNLAQAVASAITAIETVPGLRVLRVEPDDLVTATEIAQRLGRSREGVRLLISGERGRGDFPAPVSHLRSRNRLWRWSDVVAWESKSTRSELSSARLVAALNAALELRNRMAELSKRDRDLIAFLDQ